MTGEYITYLFTPRFEGEIDVENLIQLVKYFMGIQGDSLVIMVRLQDYRYALSRGLKVYPIKAYINDRLILAIEVVP